MKYKIEASWVKYPFYNTIRYIESIYIDINRPVHYNVNNTILSGVRCPGHMMVLKDQLPYPTNTSWIWKARVHLCCIYAYWGNPGDRHTSQPIYIYWTVGQPCSARGITCIGRLPVGIWVGVSETEKTIKWKVLKECWTQDGNQVKS